MTDPVLTHPPERVIVTPAKRRDAVIEVLRNARRRLILSLFRCDDFEVLDEVGEALERGVEVRILMTPRARGWGKRLKNLWMLLESMGAELRRYSGARKYHAKYIVADEGPALIASLNFTRKCFHKTCDFMVITYDPGVTAGLRRLFEFDWEAPAEPLPDGLTDRLVIAPDEARDHIGHLLDGARRTIHMIDHRVSDPEIVGILNRRLAAGVEIRVLGRGAIDGLRSHGKLIIIDGELAVTGSMSLSTPALTWRREVSLLIRERPGVRHLQDFFDNAAAPGKADEGPFEARETLDEDEEEEEETEGPS
ncbi:MAG: phospholipase D-like domain-containing protein [Bryobacteraceae bacterium]